MTESPSPNNRRGLKRFFYGTHLLLLVAGLALLALPIIAFLRSNYAQWEGNREIERQRAAAPEDPAGSMAPKHAAPAPAASVAPRVVPKRGSVLAKFEVPRLGLSYVVLEGADNDTLDKSIAHVEDTALPGESGNIGIAGHRNTHFKKLEWVRQGDEMTLTTAQDTYRYRVQSVQLVLPANVEVLDSSVGPAITLVTCFPFEYVGHAPQRFIVRAVPDEETRRKLAPVAVTTRWRMMNRTRLRRLGRPPAFHVSDRTGARAGPVISSSAAVRPNRKHLDGCPTRGPVRHGS